MRGCQVESTGTRGAAGVLQGGGASCPPWSAKGGRRLLVDIGGESSSDLNGVRPTGCSAGLHVLERIVSMFAVCQRCGGPERLANAPGAIPVEGADGFSRDRLC